MSSFTDAVSIASGLMSIITLLMLLIKPIRERVMGINMIREAQKCALRQQILHSYYTHREERSIRQYEYENLCYAYRAYKAMKGNSFIEKIYSEICTWEVVS